MKVHDGPGGTVHVLFDRKEAEDVRDAIANFLVGMRAALELVGRRDETPPQTRTMQALADELAHFTGDPVLWPPYTDELET
jgi:hypothetical protein